jgi:hypothetical protein
VMIDDGRHFGKKPQQETTFGKAWQSSLLV